MFLVFLNGLNDLNVLNGLNRRVFQRSERTDFTNPL